jgi:hypothetical protein
MHRATIHRGGEKGFVVGGGVVFEMAGYWYRLVFWDTW